MKDNDLFNIINLPSEYEKSNYFGRFIYLWQWRFYFRNYKKSIELVDIPRRRAEDDSDKIFNEFERFWNDEILTAKKKNRKPNLFWPIMRQYGFKCLLLSFVSIGAQLSILSQALSIGDLIININNLKENNLNYKEIKLNLIYTCITMIVFEILFANLSNLFIFNFYLISMKVRIGLSNLIYRKSLKLSKSALGKISIAHLVNFLSNDLNNVYYFFNYLSYPIVSIFIIFYSIYKLWYFMHWYTINGIIAMIFILPIQSIICKIYGGIRLKAIRYTDQRLLLLNEFLNAIEIIKLFAFENEFIRKINHIRKKEVDKIRKSLYLYSLNMGLFYSINKVVIYVILIFYSFSGEILTDEGVFTVLSVLNTSTFIICIYVPLFFLYTSNFWTSIKRISTFLNLEEQINLLMINNNYKKENFKSKNLSISIKNLTACYSLIEQNEDLLLLNKDLSLKNLKEKKVANVLKNISFDCKPGELIIVVGAVGSGKSSLLQAILSELRIKEGSIEVNGKISYSGQEPWIFSGTIKENILFDSEYNEVKYNEIIKVCALERDLTLFQDGDDTFIGERGVALSGGQKARINLARSLYFDADIYLLDDPLSAVDTHVANHLFNNVISKYLSKKVVILTTHQSNYLKYADKILFLKDGKQVFFDKPHKLMKKLVDEPNSEFLQFLGKNKLDISIMLNKIIVNSTNAIDDLSVCKPQSLFSKGLSLTSKNLECKLIENNGAKYSENAKGKIREENDNSLIIKAYRSYFKNRYSIYCGPLLFITFLSYKLVATFCDYFLKLWTDSIKRKANSNLELNSTNLNYNFVNNFTQIESIQFYSSLIALVALFSILRSFILFMYTMKTSVHIHNQLFLKIARAKMSFFYQTNIGMILNKFSKNINILDNLIPFALHDFFDLLLNGTVLFIMMIISSIYLAIPFIIFITIAIFFRNFFIKTSRSLETLEGVGKSPVIQHLTSTLNGLSTIRSFKAEDKFINKFNKCLNDHTSIYFTLITSKRYLVYVLDNLKLILMIGNLTILTVFAEDFSGSLVGLITSYTIMFNYEFQWLIIKWSDFESYLSSVEKLTKYNELESEPLLISEPECKPPKNWPQNARIVFNDVTMRYFENENPVLKNLNFIIEEKQKIGIVGRTGAGKSSILSALFRLTEYEGDIIIDEINCKSIGLHDLRSKITIIPQVPVLFTGTIRYNLDPLGKFKDYQLWDALKVTQLEHVVKQLEGGLDSKVMDNGGNFSVGQKQLICLARAILKENKILILDEATANCDPKTDSLIQTTIRNVFKYCSILTIAHRLNTIMDSTKILVLDAGEIKEFDTPKKLLKNENGLFRSFVYANGEEQANYLISLVKENAF